MGGAARLTCGQHGEGVPLAGFRLIIGGTKEGPAMKRLLLAMMVLGIARALTAQTETLRVKPPFRPAEARFVTDIPDRNTCVAAGTVAMDALITETGEVQQVRARRFSAIDIV